VIDFPRKPKPDRDQEVKDLTLQACIEGEIGLLVAKLVAVGHDQRDCWGLIEAMSVGRLYVLDHEEEGSL
jgi:hypothetical protein